MVAAAGGLTNFVQLKSKADVRVEITDYLNKLHSNLIEAINSGISLNQSGSLYKLLAPDIQQILIASIDKSDHGAVLCIRNILLENAIKLEKSSGFSALISTLLAVISTKSKFCIQSKSDHKDLDISSLLSELTGASRRVGRTEAFKAIKQYCKDPLTSSIVIQACNMTGHNGQIYVDNTPSSTTSIELTNGYTFQFGIEKNFFLGTKLSEWKASNPRVLLIDGVIETVGEINRLLEHMYESKHPCVIMARGFSDEVLGTLTVNKNRGTLDVIPVLIPFDLEGINALVDLSVVCKSDIVSSLKGDAIAAVEPSKLRSVESITANGLRIIIQNSVADRAVKEHIKDILIRKNETSIDDKKNLFDKRTKSLSSVCSHIKIAESGLHSKNTKKRIQHCVNMLKNISRYGCVNLCSIKFPVQNDVQKLIETLVLCGYEYVSARELIVGLKCGETLTNSIFSSTAYLVLDRLKRSIK